MERFLEAIGEIGRMSFLIGALAGWIVYFSVSDAHNKSFLLGLIMVSSAAIALSIVRIGLRFYNLRPPPIRTFLEYIGYIYGRYPPDVDRQAGEKHFRFQFVGFWVAFVPIFYGFLAFAQWINL